MKLKISLIFFLMICTHLGYTQRRVSLFYDSLWALNTKAQARFFRNSWIDTTYYMFLGPVMDYYVEGKLAMQGKYVGGVKSGTFTFYYLNGEKMMHGDFQDNQMVGIWRYFYPDGNPKQSIEFTSNDFKVLSYYDKSGTEKVKDGNGLWEGYYFSLNLKDTVYITGKVINGFKDDWWVYYDDSGTRLYEEKYKEGEFKSGKAYNSSGVIANKTDDPLGKGIFLPHSISYTERFMYAPNILQSDYPYLEFLPNDVRLYFDKNWERCEQENASYYRLTNELNTQNCNGTITDYYLNDHIYRKGRYINGNKEGEFVSYHKNGNTKSEGRYDNDKKVGAWQHYYEDGSPRQNVYFENGQLYVDQFWDEQGNLKVDRGTGEYEAFYEYASIRLKEKGKFVDYQKEGLWSGYTEKGELYFEEKYNNGELVQAHRFDEEENKIYYQKKIEQAEPGDGLDAFYDFVSKKLEYPAFARQNNIQGKVLIKFIIDKEGRLLEAKAISSPHQVLSEEAESVVKKYEKWNAGKEMGKAVEMYFILPLTFKLSANPVPTFN